MLCQARALPRPGFFFPGIPCHSAVQDFLPKPESLLRASAGILSGYAKAGDGLDGIEKYENMITNGEK